MRTPTSNQVRFLVGSPRRSKHAKGQFFATDIYNGRHYSYYKSCVKHGWIVPLTMKEIQRIPSLVTKEFKTVSWSNMGMVAYRLTLKGKEARDLYFLSGAEKRATEMVEFARMHIDRAKRMGSKREWKL